MPKPQVELDLTDTRLVGLLQDDARMTLQQLGAAVGLSAPAVLQRVRRLEARGVVRGYHADIDPQVLGQSVLAFVSVRCDEVDDVAELVVRWRSTGQVQECHRVTSGGFLLKVRVASLEALSDLSDALRSSGCLATIDVALVTEFERWAVEG